MSVFPAGGNSVVSNIEREFVLSSLNEQLRIDGRSFTDGRNMDINLGPAYGQSDVRLGGTRVLASIESQIVRPSPNSAANEGILKFQMNVSPMAKMNEFTSETDAIISRFLERGLRNSGAIDLEGLCVVSGEKVWEIKVVLTVVDYDGNILDTACTAAVCALLHFKRCDVTIDGVNIVIHDESEKDLIPLVLHHIPICTTFAFVNNIPILDPTSLETAVSSSSISCIITKYGEVCALSKPGGSPIPTDKLQLCLQHSFQRAKTITDQITEVLK